MKNSKQREKKKRLQQMSAPVMRSPLVDSALHILKGSICAILRIPTGMSIVSLLWFIWFRSYDREGLSVHVWHRREHYY